MDSSQPNKECSGREEGNGDPIHIAAKTQRVSDQAKFIPRALIVYRYIDQKLLFANLLGATLLRNLSSHQDVSLSYILQDSFDLQKIEIQLQSHEFCYLRNVMVKCDGRKINLRNAFAHLTLYEGQPSVSLIFMVASR